MTTTKDNTIHKLTKFHFALALFILSFWIVDEFNLMTLSHFEISSKVQDIVLKLTYISALVNFVIWCFKADHLKIVLSIIFLMIGLKVNSTVSDFTIFKFVIISMAISNLKVKSCLKTFVFLITLLVLYTIATNLLEINNESFIGFRNSSFRYSFGFAHANATGAFFFFTAVSIWACFKNKLSNVAFIVLSVLSYLFLSKYVDSRTSQLCFILAILIAALSLVFDTLKNKVPKSIISFLSIVAVLIFPIVAFTVIIGAYFYDPSNSVYYAVNNLFSTRVELSHRALSQFGLPWFGCHYMQPEPNTTIVASDYFYIDSFYILTVVKWGLASLALYVIGNFLVVKNAIVCGYSRISIALGLFSLYGIMEFCYMPICYDIFVFMMFMSFNKSDESVSKEKVKRVLELIRSFSIQIINIVYFVGKNLSSYLVFSGCKKFIEFKNLDNKDNEKQSEFKALHLISTGLYAFVVVLLCCVFFDAIVDYFKTVVNILKLDEFYSKNLLILAIILWVIALYLFIKSVFYGVFYVVYKKKFLLSLYPSFKYVGLICLAISIGFIVFSELIIKKEIAKRSDDLAIATNMVEALKSKYQDFIIYADKEPVIFKRSGIDVATKTIFFDSLYLDKVPNLVFADPRDEHETLFNEDYKFAKLTDSLSLYVKDENLVKIIEAQGIKLSSNYTCQKDFNLKRLAYINKVKYRHQELYLQNKEHPLLHIDPIKLTEGKYRFKFEYHLDEKNSTKADDKSVFKVILSFNNGAIKLYEGDIKIDNCNGSEDNKRNCATYFDIDLNEDKPSVNLQIFSKIMTNLYFSKISYEKYE